MVKALLGSGSRPGVWRFSLGTARKLGRVLVQRGVLVGRTHDALIFRLRGEPGERIAFSYDLED